MKYLSRHFSLYISSHFKLNFFKNLLAILNIHRQRFHFPLYSKNIRSFLIFLFTQGVKNVKPFNDVDAIRSLYIQVDNRIKQIFSVSSYFFLVSYDYLN